MSDDPADDHYRKQRIIARKQSLYFPRRMLQEMKDEATRLDRSLSWVVQRAWKQARRELTNIPSANGTRD